jgi:hypothetical protein
MESETREVCFWVEIGGVRHDTYVSFSTDATVSTDAMDEEIQKEYDAWVRSLRRDGGWYFTDRS